MYIFKNLQVVILPLLARVAWKRLQIGRDMLLIITSNIVTSFLLV